MPVTLKLKQLRENAGLSLEDMARAAGYSGKNSYRYWEDPKKFDGSVLPSRIIKKILPPLTERGISEQEVYELGELPMPSNGMSGYMLVPQYDVAASAGAGNYINQENQIDQLAFKTEWLSRITNSPREKLAVITAEGDSMTPTLNDGDCMLIDINRTKLSKDGIFVLNNDGELVVKRATYNQATKRVCISSDNPTYTAYDAEPDQVVVIGRVIWAGRKV